MTSHSSINLDYNIDLIKFSTPLRLLRLCVYVYVCACVCVLTTVSSCSIHKMKIHSCHLLLEATSHKDHFLKDVRHKVTRMVKKYTGQENKMRQCAFKETQV